MIDLRSSVRSRIPTYSEGLRRATEDQAAGVADASLVITAVDGSITRLVPRTTATQRRLVLSNREGASGALHSLLAMIALSAWRP